MSIAVDYDRLTRERARLVILQELSKQATESLSSPFFDQALKLNAIMQDTLWVNQEINYLKTMGAVTVIDVGDDVLIARLTNHGRRHLDREITIPGVDRPRRPGM